jgi:hypothetical protein
LYRVWSSWWRRGHGGSEAVLSARTTRRSGPERAVALTGGLLYGGFAIDALAASRAVVGFVPQRPACARGQTAAPSLPGHQQRIAPDGGAVTERSEGKGASATLTAAPPAPPSLMSRRGRDAGAAPLDGGCLSLPGRPRSRKVSVLPLNVSTFERQHPERGSLLFRAPPTDDQPERHRRDQTERRSTPAGRGECECSQ